MDKTEKRTKAIFHVQSIKGAHAHLRHELIRFINMPDGKNTTTLSTGETAIDMDDAWLIIGKKDGIHTPAGSPFLRDKREQWLKDENPDYNLPMPQSNDMLINWDTDRLMELALKTVNN